MYTWFTAIRVMFLLCSKDERLKRPRNVVTRELQLLFILVCFGGGPDLRANQALGEDRHYVSQSPGRRAGWEEGRKAHE
jgi:hypothetical protein